MVECTRTDERNAAQVCNCLEKVANTRVWVGNRTPGRGEEIAVNSQEIANKGHDIGILHLARAVKQPQNIVRYGSGPALIKTGVNVAIRGWGAETKDGDSPSPSLKVCSLKVVTSAEDLMDLTGLNGFTGYGDSGAGVWDGSVVQGIVSYGDQTSGTVAVPTSLVADWILSVTGFLGIPS
ncbi:trypsin-like serine protease [Solihabitans fulvus]|uniref:trypsin-like serine protease n=1 Tax=Solihabitans fulvus TaxID=1892852 RepID=UPI0016619F78|nr:trypsin-like serine protease [Solihabitans fulvus]